MHTPTPWIYDDSFRYYASRVIRRNGEIVCSFTSPYEGADDDNAQFIVRVCNAHEELLEACKGLLESVEALKRWNGDPSAHASAVAKAEAAITKAGGS